MTARCARSGPTGSSAAQTTLRIGFPEVGSADALNGIRQVRQILSMEGLAKIGEDGRPVPWLAEGWTMATDGLSMKIRLRPGVKFHDGSPVNAATVVTALSTVLPEYLGPAFDDVEYIKPAGEAQIDIGFRRPSPFLLEALEAPVQKPGSASVSTGPYMAAGTNAPNEMRANSDYYLGAPTIDRITVNTYPNVRSAWADMLRDRVDMLYEVGVDALDSLASARNVSVFTYVRHYQYVLILNTQSGPLRSPEIRRALNRAIDPDALIRDAFDGHAKPSSGPIWPQHWAFRSDLARFSYDPQAASAVLGRSGARREAGSPAITFKCLAAPRFERLALTLKRQFEAVGAEMSVEEAPLASIMQALAKHDFDAVLLETVSGPSLFRPYVIWHSGSLLNPAGIGNHKLDVALDGVRNARDDNEYRVAVADVQKAIVDDPPAIFLAWSERARAVSNRFRVPAEPGRDILTNLRLWQPVTDESIVSRR
jgi:peptide/nickel transport system substrate-binding protein